ncbi:MAG: hypothetical protein Edafosvirus8_26 [Edafosvirus sp.]|uniref:Uncharacterized protein n=1 Tax=Edafosvirus sp. TaxID=2487765 RepID=A0A3G4ZTP8_9VIRU|nr:MAG: hypothetical protein Edafosvirus8_26 [Edafosvirus sp.]
MSQKEKTYDIVCSNTLENLIEKVNELMTKNYKPHKQPFNVNLTCRIRICQTMVKKSGPNDVIYVRSI